MNESVHFIISVSVRCYFRGMILKTELSLIRLLHFLTVLSKEEDYVGVYANKPSVCRKLYNLPLQEIVGNGIDGPHIEFS
jgi:hypothetical protein